MKIIRSEDYTAFNRTSLALERKFSLVKTPLPWVEPSINMIHLDAVRSFIFGSSLASIGCATYLLEHSLRMAIWDPINSGSLRKKPTKAILNATMGQLLRKEQYTNNLKIVVPEADDRLWWQRVTKAVRNKVNHVDIPAIFRIARELRLKSDYAYSWLDETSSWNTKDPHSWGMFWHRYGEKLAADFIVQVTEQVSKLLNNTTWKPDETWWISQKYEYNHFFQESWDFESLKRSLNQIYTEIDSDSSNQ